MMGLGQRPGNRANGAGAPPDANGPLNPEGGTDTGVDWSKWAGWMMVAVWVVGIAGMVIFKILSLKP